MPYAFYWQVAIGTRNAVKKPIDPAMNPRNLHFT